MKSKDKYLFLYLKTGGGHYAPAKAVAEKIESGYNTIEPLLTDGFAESPAFVRYVVEEGYRKLQSEAKWVYHFLYFIGKPRISSELNTFYVFFFTRKYIEKVILNERPEKIIILHFFLIKPVYYVLRRHKLDIPVLTFVTDPFTAHPMWFMEKRQHFIIFSRRLFEKLSKRFTVNRLNVFPFVVNEKFSNSMTPEEISMFKLKLGIKEKKVILILGGGDGIPKGRRILKELAQNPPGARVIIVCGKNEKLKKQAEKINERYKLNLIIFGYVDFVYELINASDIVVSKCGASTMMEILLLKKVPVINSFIWEQEKGNIDFIINNKLGIYEPSAKKLTAVLNRLILDEEFYNSFRINMEAMKLKNGLEEVTKFISGSSDFREN